MNNHERPHVVYLCSWPIGARGQGAISFIYEQIDLLSRHVRATYIVPGFSRAGRWLRLRISGKDVVPIADLWPEHVEALQFDCPRWSNRLTGRSRFEDIWRAGPRLASRLVGAVGKIDLIHAHVVLPAGLLATSMARALDVPFLLQEHQAPFEKHLDEEEKRRRVRTVLGSAGAIVAVGEDLAERMRPYMPQQASPQVVHEMVRTDLYTHQPRRSDNGSLRLVTVGSLDERKDHHALVKAVRALSDRGMNVKARIVGEGPLRRDLGRWIEEYGLAPDVELTGHLGREQVRDELVAADIYVHTSHRETFGIAPAEALAVGRPVVTTRCGGPELFVDSSCGEVVEPGDPHGLARAIGSVAGRLADFDPERLHRRMDGLFGPAAFQRRMLGIYEKLLRP